MKIEVATKKNMFGKKVCYEATFGTFRETGNTKLEAKENLIKALKWYFEDEFNNTLTAVAQDTIFIFERTFYGFELTNINKMTGKKGCITTYPRMTTKEAEKRFQEYVRQYIEAS